MKEKKHHGFIAFDYFLNQLDELFDKAASFPATCPPRHVGSIIKEVVKKSKGYRCFAKKKEINFILIPYIASQSL